MSSGEDMITAFARLVGKAVAAELRGSSAAEVADDGEAWIDQSESPLGSRLHIAAVRRRMQAGLGGAGKRYRQYLLTRSALQEEMLRSPKPGMRKAVPRGEAPAEADGKATTASATLARLRLLRGQPKKG